MKISCAILCYNYGRYLPQAIDSCLNQAPADCELEVLVIDDGSTDDTPEVCARYGTKIRVARSANEGFGASLTKAIRLTTGDYVCLLDADDYFAPDKLATLRPYLETKPLILTNRCYQVDPKSQLLDNELHACPTSGWTVRRHAALDLTPIKNDVYFTLLEVADSTVTIERGLTYYRVHDASMQRGQAPGVWQRKLASAHRDFAQHIDRLLQSPPAWMPIEHAIQKRNASRAGAAFCELEASLQRKARRESFQLCADFWWTALRNKRVNMLLPKMLVRTLLGIPNFKV